MGKADFDLEDIVARAKSGGSLNSDETAFLADAYETQEHSNRVLEEKNERLTELSGLDPLTEAGNVRYFEEELRKAIDFSNRAYQKGVNLPVALLYIDLDFFKQFNDTYGHLSGDEALKCVTKIMKATVRNPNTVCRIGGEEFAIIAEGEDSQGGYGLAERLRRNVETELKERMEKEVGGRITCSPLTISIGVYHHEPEDVRTSKGIKESYVTLRDKADKALYQAKHAGRNRVEIHRERG